MLMFLLLLFPNLVFRVDELAELGITLCAPDFGLAAGDRRGSRKVPVVFNASTITKNDISAWRAAGASTFCRRRNYYPRATRALSLGACVTRAFRRLVSIFSFVPGEIFRGPLYEGLPTVENTVGFRAIHLFRQCALSGADSDVVLIGDPDVTEGPTWKRISQRAKPHWLKTELKPDF